MRTYTRKRTEYQVIEDVHEMCRLCLEKVKESVPIFTDNDSVCASLTMRIMMCVGVEISKEDCLPNVICAECHKELNNYYEFKKKCILTYQKLKSHVLAVKQLEAKQNADAKCSKGDTVNNKDAVKPVTEPNSSILKTSFHQDISEFLTSILLELGIMRQNGDHMFLADQSVSLIEIESGDNNKIVLEMLEINEEPQNGVNNQISKSDVSTEPSVKLIMPSYTEKHIIPPKKESQVRCIECGKRFDTNGALRRHMRVHTGERPYVCALCGRAFSQREMLRRHEPVHTEDRPFKCTSCSKSFTQRGSLAAHVRSHERAMALHRCPRCPRVFLHASGLSRHTMMHNGRVFECVACKRRFSDKSSLLRHLRLKHPLLVEQGSA